MDTFYTLQHPDFDIFLQFYGMLLLGFHYFYLCIFLTNYLFIYLTFGLYFSLSPLLPVPPPTPLCSHPQSSPPPLVFRKEQVSHGSQQSMVY